MAILPQFIHTTSLEAPLLLVEPYRGSQHHRERLGIPDKADRLHLPPYLSWSRTDLLVTGDATPKHEVSWYWPLSCHACSLLGLV